MTNLDRLQKSVADAALPWNDPDRYAGPGIGAAPAVPHFDADLTYHGPLANLARYYLGGVSGELVFNTNRALKLLAALGASGTEVLVDDLKQHHPDPEAVEKILWAIRLVYQNAPDRPQHFNNLLAEDLRAGKVRLVLLVPRELDRRFRHEAVERSSDLSSLGAEFIAAGLGQRRAAK
jgi:hypothetical protein